MLQDYASDLLPVSPLPDGWRSRRNVPGTAAEGDKGTVNQDAVYLVSNPLTARWSYIETDKNGKQIATIYNSVESVEGDGVNGNLKLRVEEVPVASPKDTITTKSMMMKDVEKIKSWYAYLNNDSK